MRWVSARSARVSCVLFLLLAVSLLPLPGATLEAAAQEALVPTWVNVRENNTYCWGYATPNSQVTATLKDADQQIKKTWNGTLGDSGNFWAYFDPVLIEAGDTVEVVPDVGFPAVVPVVPLTATPDPETDTVSGTGPPVPFLR